jgi:hypothetical protein
MEDRYEGELNVLSSRLSAKNGDGGGERQADADERET